MLNAARKVTEDRQIVSSGNKVLVGLGLVTCLCVSYLIPNRFQLTKPLTLPLTRIDRKTPFLPATIWVYLSQYLLLPIAYGTLRDPRNLDRFFYSFLALQFWSGAWFFLLPTVYPVERYPIPETAIRLNRAPLSVLRTLDAPTNCFPSFHSSSAYLASLLIRDEQPKKFPFFFAWAHLISISTMTIKRHYLADLLGGFGAAVLFHRFFRMSVSERRGLLT